MENIVDVCLNFVVVFLKNTCNVCKLVHYTLSFTETAKDTTNSEVTEVTFEPKLSTFDDDIMEAMGIKEDRKRAKTYFY